MSGRHAHEEADLDPAPRFARYVRVPLDRLATWLAAGWRVRYRTPDAAVLVGTAPEPPPAAVEW